MEHVPENKENPDVLPITEAKSTFSESTNSDSLSQQDFPAQLKQSFANLVMIEDEYEGLSSTEATADVQHCRELLNDQERQITQLVRNLNQEKSRLQRLQGDLEEAEVCLSMSQSYEAALAGWRETLHAFDALHRESLNQQQTFSLSEQAWEDLKHAEQQALTELDTATTYETIHTPYGSTTIPKQEGMLPDEISIEILGDYLPVSILTDGARLSLDQCQEGTATYAVHCL
ncbi:hypothetical protein [Gimesia panareensis]|uniref:hypothetical protein n=1 Tax=Gimesia panareensis TaxID=2527978 RepID=UPI00118A7539|nr:hypothetical protein [Gimesia panareensis]QDU53557.1 hypothetical protein Pan110_59490 [Gimesia panareensis]